MTTFAYIPVTMLLIVVGGVFALIIGILLGRSTKRYCSLPLFVLGIVMWATLVVSFLIAMQIPPGVLFPLITSLPVSLVALIIGWFSFRKTVH